MSQYSSSAFSKDTNSSWFKTFELIPPSASVLDVGCSSGTFGSQLIAKKRCIVDGIEINDSDLIKAQKKLRKVYKLNIETDDLNIETKYDVIFMGDVVEHLAQPIPALKKLMELLKPNGQLIFSIPNITHILVRLMLLEGKIQYGKTGLLDETHLHFYNREEIYRVFNDAGYEIVNFDYTINDMPYDLAKTRLKSLGLTPNKEFGVLLKSLNAKAYQFIGVAVKAARAKHQKLPDSSPANIIEDYIIEIRKDYEQVINDLKENMKKISEDRDRIILDRDRIQNELELSKHRLKNAVLRKLKDH